MVGGSIKGSARLGRLNSKEETFALDFDSKTAKEVKIMSWLSGHFRSKNKKKKPWPRNLRTLLRTAGLR
jgi:hypothetical protein